MTRRILVTMLALVACHTSPTPNESRGDVVPPAAAPAALPSAVATSIAVVELFTSEGCNSCPPADAALATLASERRDDATAVVVLSFHVDYWDELGWKDPYASARNTGRQREYARVFGTSSVFTPQMIVNGVEQFVGSDLARARAAIGRAAPTKTSLSIDVTRAGAKLAVHHRLDGAPGDALLHVALVERGAETNVRAGENAGKHLRHVGVVRGFVSRANAEAESTTSIDLPAGVDVTNADIVAYAQSAPLDAQRGAPILAAARAPVPAPRP